MTTIQLRRGTTSQWLTSTKALALGEPGVDTTTGDFKIGNGSSLWAGLPHLQGLPGQDGTSGRAIDLQSGETHIQWRYVGDPTWTNLIAIADITGPPGSGSGGGGATNAEVAAFVSGAGATRTAVDARVAAGITGKADLVGGVIPSSQLPSLAINETFTPANQAAMLALVAERGDMAIRTDNGRTYVLTADAPTVLANWKEVLAAGQVASVAGKTGVVALVKADVGLPNVDNTSDANKPISAATQAALNALGSSFARFVIVTTGTEARPVGGLVLWLDMREGEVSVPANMGASDVRFRPGTVAPTPTAPVITTPALSSLTQSVAFSQTLAASGTTPITWTVSGGTIPAGLTLSAGGVLSGTPTGSGAYSFTVTATNTAGSDPQLFTGTIGTTAVAPVITTTTLNTLTQGSAFSQTLAATGSTPITFAVTTGTLPAGLALSTAGVLSGTPSAAGAYSFTVTATNAAGSDPQAYSGTIAATGASVFSVFGAASPGTGAINTDGGGSLWVGNRFYTSKAAGINVRGVRIWEPASSDSTFLNLDVVARLFKNDWAGSTIGGAATFASAVLATKTHTALRVAGTWTDILFDTPVALPKIAAGAGATDLLTLAVQYAGGNHYVTVTSSVLSTEDSIDSAASPGTYLAEQASIGRGVNSIASGAPATYYGIDVLFEVA